MVTFAVFIISLLLIIFLFVIKRREISTGQKIFLEEFFLSCDRLILNIISKIKFWWSHVNFKNLHLLFSWLIVNLKKIVISLKRRFDHQQSHFFAKKDNLATKSKGPVSFFLKDVSDYKKSLRENKKK